MIQHKDDISIMWKFMNILTLKILKDRDMYNDIMVKHTWIDCMKKKKIEVSNLKEMKQQGKSEAIMDRLFRILRRLHVIDDEYFNLIEGYTACKTSLLGCTENMEKYNEQV